MRYPEPTRPRRRTPTQLPWALGSFCVLALATGCDSSHLVHLDDAADVTKGSDVVVSGVRVGRVDDVRVVGEHVELELAIDDDNELALGTSTCVTLRPTTPTRNAFVELVPGGGGERDPDTPIEVCPTPPAELAAAATSTLGEEAERRDVLATEEPTETNEDSPVATPPPSLDPPCVVMDARIDRVEPVAPVEASLPDGGHRVWIVFRNTSDITMEVGWVSQTTFVDIHRRALTPARVRADAEDWSVPFDVPARGTARRAVVFEGREPPRLDEIESRRSAPAGDPTAHCTWRATGLQTSARRAG